jgi:formate-dependent nitrite reductase membrane component NrfD
VITPDDVAASLGRNDGGFGREQTSYYDLPVLQKPHWEWEIEWYFFIGGVASGSAILSALSDVIGDPDDAQVVRIGRYAATLGAAVSGVLLIKDLGRPERFLNMMRIVKLKSPMSVGVYALTAFSTLSGFALTRQAKADGLLPFDPTGWIPSVLFDIAWAGSAALLGSYTGVLIGATAIPVWFIGSRHLPAIFVCSATSTACAFTLAILALLPATKSATMRKIERLEIFAATAELLLLRDYKRRAGELGDPFFSGRIGRKLQTITELLGIVAPVAINLPSALGRNDHALGKTGRAVAFAGAALTLAGGFVLRESILRAGKISAENPRHYLKHKELGTPSKR